MVVQSILIAKKLLDHPIIVPALQQVSGEEMPEGVAALGVEKVGCNDHLLDRTFHDRFM